MRPTINQIRASSDHALSFRWNVIFSEFPALLPNKPSSDDLNIRAESAEQPSRVGQTIKTNVRGHTVNQTGVWTYNPITLTFVETTDNMINQFIHEWIELSWESKTGKSVTKENMEAVIILQRLDNADEPIVEFRCVGCIPEVEEKGGSLVGEGGEVLRPTLTLSIDYYERTALI